MTTTLRWTKTPATVRAGVYEESNVTVTGWTTPDGAFSIVPTGSMRRSKTHGFYGSVTNRFVWSGYRLSDHRPDRPAYVPKTRRYYTVSAAKREAARRLAGDNDNG